MEDTDDDLPFGDALAFDNTAPACPGCGAVGDEPCFDGCTEWDTGGLTDDGDDWPFDRGGWW